MKRSIWWWMTGVSFIICHLAFSVSACSSIDCPVESRVYTVYELADTLRDTLNVTTRTVKGKDTLLINGTANATTLSLQISYAAPVDTFVFKTLRLPAVDTVWVAKENIPHFESVDCAAAYFHHITSVTCTHQGIDSIVLIHPTVNYDASQAHFRIYFKARP